MRRILLFVLLLALSASFAKQASAQMADDYGRLIQEGIASYETGDLDAAKRHFSDAVSSDKNRALGHYWLAKVYLHPSVGNPGEAFRQLKLARDIDPDNLDFLLERLRQLSSGYSFFGIYDTRASERRRIADRIVAIDSTNASAYGELARTYRNEFDQFRSVKAVELSGGAWIISQVRWSRDNAHGAVERAIDYYIKSMEHDRSELSSYRELISMLLLAARSFDDQSSEYFDMALNTGDLMGTRFPESPVSWKLRGLILYMTGCLECAAAQFERAKGLMTIEERAEFDTIELLLGYDAFDLPIQDVDSLSHAYWKARERQHLTRINEREVSHYARIVYADLFYGKWRRHLQDPDYISPGEIIVRYGIPDRGEFRIAPRFSSSLDYTQAQLIVRFSNINESFMFTDDTGDGDWTIYSRQNEFDPVIRAQDTFRAFPEEASQAAGSFDMPFQFWRMRNETGQPELIVTYGIPLARVALDDDDVPLTIRTGVFLVDAQNVAYDYVVEEHAGLNRTQIVRHDSVDVWANTAVVRPNVGPSTISVEGKSAYTSSANRYLVDIEPTDNQLHVSDPLFAVRIEETAEPVENEGVFRNGFSIQPNPISSFNREQPIYLYYEIYNLPQDDAGRARYRTEVVLTPIAEGGLFDAVVGRLRGGQESPVAVSFESNIESDADAQYRILDLSNYEPGPYHVIVRIVDSVSGQAVSSGRDVRLR